MRFCHIVRATSAVKRGYTMLKLHIIANLLDASQRLVSLNKPSEAEYRSLRNYMKNKKPLVKAEENWIEWKEDMITIRPGREHAWLDRCVEHVLRLLHCRLVEVCVFDFSDDERFKADIYGIVNILPAGVFIFC